MRIKQDLPTYNAPINLCTECSERKKRRGPNKKKIRDIKFLKVWWLDATPFVYFDFHNIHTFIRSQYIHPSPFAEASLLSLLMERSNLVHNLRGEFDPHRHLRGKASVRQSNGAGMILLLAEHVLLNYN